MWQRWNQGTNLFEKSLDNGGSWTPLPVAYTDRNNNFAVAQSFAAGASIAGGLNVTGGSSIAGGLTVSSGGLGVTGNIDGSGFVRAGVDNYLYDKGRGIPIGYQQVVGGGNAFVGCTLNSTIVNDFFWVGNYIFWNFGFNVNIPALATEIAVSAPPGMYVLSTSSGACGYTNLPIPAIWYTTGSAGDYWLRIRLKDISNFAAGTNFDFRGQAILRTS